MKAIKNLSKCLVLGISALVMCVIMQSCGSFGEAMLMGMSQASYGYSPYSTSSYSTGSSYVSTFLPTTFTYTPATSTSSYDSSSSSSYSSSSSSSSSRSSSTSSSSSTTSAPRQKTCIMHHAHDYIHCNGTGRCQNCNGKGTYYDSSYGISGWKSCTYCNSTGKCRSCGGTGHL